jgi:hypothetical protein
MVHSTTILLPMWFKTLERLKLPSRKMPRDVATRWNSTFDMLEFAVTHQDAIDEITGDKSSGLRQFELSNDEWIIAGQLRNVLWVCFLATQLVELTH